MYYDVSLPIEDEMILFPGDQGTRVRKDQDIEKDGVNVSRMTLCLHAGTHIDSPAHFIAGGKTIDEIPIEQFMGKCRVYDFSGLESKKIDAKHIANLEFDCDTVFFKTDNSLLLLKKQFDTYYTCITEAAASLLVRKGVKAFGFDYLTIDKLATNEAHMALLSAGILIFETVNLINIKEGKYDFFAIPLRIKGAEASPARIILKD